MELESKMEVTGSYCIMWMQVRAHSTGWWVLYVR